VDEKQNEQKDTKIAKTDLKQKVANFRRFYVTALLDRLLPCEPFLFDYIGSSLVAGRVRERLGAKLADRMLEFVRARRDVYWSIANCTRLIHSDYNLKNILIRHIDSVWKVVGILDWEFALAGSPLVDIGNFLRFEDELPSGVSEAFIRGYLSNSIGLPDNWREVAKLLDLAAMVNFLDDERDAPKTFRTAIAVITKTIRTSACSS